MRSTTRSVAAGAGAAVAPQNGQVLIEDAASGGNGAPQRGQVTEAGMPAIVPEIATLAREPVSEQRSGAGVV
jgi:hypothetical protein